MDFKKLIQKISSMDDAVDLPKAPELPKSIQLNEDAQLRVLAGQSSVVTEAAIMEKAVSQAQQKAAGAALAAKRGEGSAKGASKEMMKMSTKELEKFAGTKHKGLPEKKTKEGVNEAAIDDYLDKKKADGSKTDSDRRKHSGSRYGGSAQKDDAEDDKPEAKKGRKATKESVELDIEEFNDTFSQMVEAAKKEPAKSSDKKSEKDAKKDASKKSFEKKFGGSAADLTKGLKIREGAKPDFLDIDKDGDKKEPMKKAVADKKKGAVGKKTVKESVERKLSFKEMVKLVQESGGQQQIDPTDQALFSWAQRVAVSKLGEGTKAELYAGLVYERMGGRFEMYDVLIEGQKK